MESYSQKQLISRVNRQKALVFIATARNKKIKVKTVQFTGIKTIQWLYIKKETTFSWEFVCLQGKAVFYLVRNKELFPLILEEGKKEKTITLPPGWVRLRIAGEHASCQLELNRY